MAGAAPFLSQNPGEFSRCPVWVQGSKASDRAFPGRQGAGRKVRQPGCDLVPLWDPGVCQLRI